MNWEEVTSFYRVCNYNWAIFCTVLNSIAKKARVSHIINGSFRTIENTVG